MATTGSVAAFGFRAISETSANKKTGSVAKFSFAATTGVFATGGGITYNDAAKKSWLPPPRQPIGFVEIAGKSHPVYMDASWYAAFNYMFNVKLGGIDSPTVPEVTDNLEETKIAATTAQSQASQAYSVGRSAAETANSAREVLQTNGTPGSESIPKAITS